VSDRYDLAGNLYRYSAEAFEKDFDFPKALRAYEKVLEEKQVPVGELAERARLPGKIRSLHLAWIESLDRQAKPLSGEAASRIETARAKAPAEAIPALMEIATAKDLAAESRGAAESALALACAKESLPYEAMEWIERAARDRVDPGSTTAGVVVAAIKGYPGLAERWDAVAPALEALRKGQPVAVKPDPVTPTPPQPVTPTPAPAPAVEGRIGVLTVINKYGIYVRLEVEASLSKGDVLEVLRGGAPVGEIIVDKMHTPDKNYPLGSAECRKGQGTIEKGDDVRRKK
jgi:hypothetical protein